ncbi:gametogenetin-binding protein 2-like isoform X2 [Babylonia areolata]|uniref:gametogenetin-binding protein 2-like isoform X2 n=1 Tax=Babylonia areolata TaxID=304850 RepID=UPI003FD27D36
MARLISLCKRETTFSRRQMPLEESDIKMVVQFSNCGDCEGQVKQKELDKFISKCHVLDKDDLVVSLMVTKKEVFSHLAQSLPCVGCRRSVESLFLSLERSGHPTLEPLVVTQHSELSISADVCDPRSLYCLFYIHGPRHRAVLDTITKGRSKKRCNLHSLDTHKVKMPSCWTEVWQTMNPECQGAVLIVSCTKFEETLSSYLTKHRFCTECRSKVMLAYNILIGDQDGQAEKGYCVRLFEKLRTCNKEGDRHIHISEDYTYIEMLINMAEPELTGTNRRDRHAKTLDIAQEEVLTCLGLHIYERLHKISQKLRQEEQTWNLLFCLGVEALQKNFECAVERKQGVSNLERMCEEMEEEERIKEQRKEQKRLKKKRKKAAKSGRENQAQLSQSQASHCQCSSVSIATKPLQTSHLAQCDNHSSHCTPSSNNNHHHLLHSDTCNHPFPQHHHHHHHHLSHFCDVEESSPCTISLSPNRCSNDCGYSSEAEGCDNCNTPSSNEGSDICSDGMCLHEGEECPQLLEGSFSHCRSSGGSPERKFTTLCQSNDPCMCGRERDSYQPSKSMSTLQEMLASTLSCEDEEDDSADCGISEEDIRLFQANRTTVQQQRLELRENLKRRFQTLRQQGASPISSPSSSPSPSPYLCSRFEHA